MDTAALKKFAPAARTQLIDDVTSRLSLVLAEGSATRREHPTAVRALEGAIARNGRAQVIEQVAYTWFNRFTALRFMDVHGYTALRTVSPAEGQTRPEILSEAMAGHIDDAIPERTRARIAALLEGRTPSAEPQAEAYRLLLVAVCNHWHAIMPYMFERIDDFTELLMPGDLLSPTSILARLSAVMSDGACADVEIIGWLYQFYISEKKDQVFAGLKKNIKVTAENIPAATQLFTPHWIVRYLVENSLGRLWLLNRPGSRLAERMDYYIAPEEPETDFLRISRPEEIRICDPACGSGHMLTYAFDLLHVIYEEEGHEAAEIPGLILKHNLIGVEIDDRAGALAAFALAMKAAAKLGRRRFLRMEVQPNIVVMQDVVFTPAELRDVAVMVGRDMFTDEMRETLGQFEQAKNFGSLIVPRLRNPAETLRAIEARDFGGDLLLREMQERVGAVLRMAEALSPKYHVVVANPPYMGSGGMNPQLKNYLGDFYKNSKSDLMTAFIERFKVSVKGAYIAAVTLDSWMFLASFERFRSSLFEWGGLTSVAHIGWNCFPEGHTYNRGVAFILESGNCRILGKFFNLANVPAVVDKRKLFLEKKSSAEFYRERTENFRRIPGAPVAYWISPNFRRSFEDYPLLQEEVDFKIGMATGKNEDHVRAWSEVSLHRVSFGCRSRAEASKSGAKWFPYAKGGPVRKWAGNREFLVNWEQDGRLLQTTKHPSGDRIWAHNFNLKNIFKPAICWTQVTSAGISFRYYNSGFLFDAAAGLAQPRERISFSQLLGFLNSKVAELGLDLLNPTINLLPGTLGNLPAVPVSEVRQAAEALILAEEDWNAYETSWDFTKLPLLSPHYFAGTLEATYARLRAHWQGMTDEMKRLEEENNRIFIDAYGLQDELIPEVPIEEITLTCNPAYRYGVKTSKDEREARLKADTMAEFLHYAVSCMFGRYSLDVPGLILADQGEGLAEYLARVPEPSFAPDTNNVIPLLDTDWFPDDVTERFRKFLRVTFGEERFRENLRFVEESLGKDIRRWFTKDFYDYHVRRYKKRPIYWLFASPKGSFQALIYMHRYRPDTVSVLLNDYVREFITKLQAERRRLETLADDPAATQAQRTRAVKDAATIARQLEELTTWERNVVFPLAQRQIAIDLDDGVKANYPKFAPAVKPIKGLEDADE